MSADPPSDQDSAEGIGRLHVTSIDAEGLDAILEHLAPTELWARVCDAYDEVTDGGTVAFKDLPKAELVRILTVLFSDLSRHVELGGGATLADLARGDSPARIMGALDAAVHGAEAEEEDAWDDSDDSDAEETGLTDEESELVDGALDNDASDADTDRGGPQTRGGGRSVFRFRAVYTAERGADHAKFRLMGVVDGEERKIMISIRWNRPTRAQLAHAEGMHGVQITPIGRLEKAIEIERSRRKKR